MVTQKQIDEHRKEAFLTCPETCWCWDAQAKLIENEEILTAFENHIDKLRKSNEMWSMSQEELCDELLEFLEILLK